MTKYKKWIYGVLAALIIAVWLPVACTKAPTETVKVETVQPRPVVKPIKKPVPKQVQRKAKPVVVAEQPACLPLDAICHLTR